MIAKTPIITIIRAFFQNATGSSVDGRCSGKNGGAQAREIFQRLIGPVVIPYTLTFTFT